MCIFQVACMKFNGKKVQIQKKMMGRPEGKTIRVKISKTNNTFPSFTQSRSILDPDHIQP
jgi:hypothetical protein